MNGYDRSSYQKRDSAIIESSSEKIIVVQEKGINSISYSKETETHLKEFQYLEIYQQANKSKTDFTLSNKWEYEEKNSHDATYACIVNQSDF